MLGGGAHARYGRNVNYYRVRENGPYLKNSPRIHVVTAVLVSNSLDDKKICSPSPGHSPKTADQGNQHQGNILTTCSLAEELEIVKQHVQKYEDQEETDLKASLTIAAEAGNLLLKENSNLKRDIQVLLKQKSSLEATISGLELKLEDISEQETKFSHKFEILQENFQQTLAQLAKEKQHRSELQNLSEENDRMQTFLLDELQKTILDLEKNK
ncbi:hypothetical protein J6590_046909 [Homalodisca vitripennis]|nr:hypothetical protein J6590_046909 [Homalodisca vitripennis]